MNALKALAFGSMAMLVAGTASAATPYKAPRTVNGQPDLQGAWTNISLTPLERDARLGDRKVLTKEEVARIEGERAEIVREGDAPTPEDFDISKAPCYAGNLGTNSTRSADYMPQNCGYNSQFTDHGDHVMRVAGEPRSSLITFPASGRIPARVPRQGPAPAPRVRTPPGENPETYTLGERCITSFGNHAGPVMLPSYYNSNYQIVQSRDAVAILVEMVHDVRIIPLTSQHGNGKPWYGDSIGRWEGDTLVVETINYNPRQNSFRGANPDTLKVTERFTRVGPDRMLYQFKVEDPTVWAEPWGGEYEMSPAKGQVYEYACHEGNYAMPNILAGARAEDAAAAARAAAGARPAGTQ